MEQFSIDSRDRNEQDKQIKFLKQAVSLSDVTFPIECFSLTTSRRIGGICSTSVIFSEKLSPYQGNLLLSSNFLGHSITILAELSQLEKFPQTSCYIPLFSVFLQSVFKVK